MTESIHNNQNFFGIAALFQIVDSVVIAQLKLEQRKCYTISLFLLFIMKYFDPQSTGHYIE